MNYNGLNEKFISYVWFNKLFYTEQKTLLGERVEIISTGKANHDAGPDVFNAMIKIDGQMWAGNVEFHVKASDWHTHGHDNDPKYQHIILHVVLFGNEQIMRSGTNEENSSIPTIVLRYPDHISRQFNSMMNDNNMCHCANEIKQIESIFITNWLDRLVVERVEQKTALIDNILDQTKGDWQEAFYVLLVRSFGFKTNSDAMQRLAMQTPFFNFLHHRQNLTQIEALFLGQAGFLEGLHYTNDTEMMWYREYELLRRKFEIEHIDAKLWKFARMRPSSFPTIRLAQLSALFHSVDNIFTSVISNPSIDKVRKIFDITPSSYWHTHYTIGEASPSHSGKLSKDSIDLIVINTLVPFLFRYGQTTGQRDLTEQSIQMLHSLNAEDNYITRYYASIGLKALSAFDSQAIIQLHNNYCVKRDCLRCHLSYRILKRNE